MNILSKIFSAGVGKTVSSIGDAIDGIVTSDEERMTLKNALAKVESDALASFDSEVTDRHAADMASDSWLSKNIRPLTLAFLIVSTVFLAYATIFGQINKDKIDMIKPWISLLTTLDVTALTFYFGSRGFEKVASQKK